VVGDGGSGVRDGVERGDGSVAFVDVDAVVL
jgi:hypothetical protein